MPGWWRTSVGTAYAGRNRYRACIDAGVEPRFESYEGDDPVGYIVSLNLRRRHLDPSQRAMAAARLATLKLGDNQYTKEGAGIQAPSQAQAAAMLNVSRGSVQKGRVVVERGSLDLQRAVEAGRVSVSAAAEIALTGKDSQVRLLALTDDEIVEEAARVRRERQIEKVAQQCSESRADLFAEFNVELPVDAKIHFDRFIETVIAAIGKLDKIVADAIWSLKLPNRKKVKAGLKKYSNEIERLPERIEKLLAAIASAHKTKPG
jgi:hypothetical protein